MIVTARICWTMPAEGGRESLPAGSSYSTVARFKDVKADWQEAAWSLVIDFIEPIDASRCTVARIRFLNPDGPTELLKPGETFELFEGRRLVATGTVL